MSNLKRKIGRMAEMMNTPCLQGSARAAHAIDTMERHDVDIIGVLCEGDFVGTFSRRDFQRSVIRQNLTPQDTNLYEVMTVNPPYVEADSTIKETLEVMLAYQWDYMPVLKHRKLCGIVSIHDLGLIKELIEDREKMRNENEILTKYIRCGENYAIASYSS